MNSLNLKANDEVIVPSFTIISCLAAIVRSGAKPVFCDVDKNSWNMRLEDVESVYTSKTKAVLLVHTYGLAAEASKISQFCQEKNLILIEDAAEAHGQSENGKKCGSFGKLSTFSFYANKHITTGEGGMILTDSDEDCSKLKKMRDLDFNNQKRFQHENFYWNYRLGGIQASLGLSQINSLEKTIQFKINQGNHYLNLFSDIEEKIQLPLKEHNGTQNHFWVFGIVLNKKYSRADLVKYLIEKGVETRPFFWPLHLQKALNANLDKLDLKTSEMLGRNGLYIPTGKHISKRNQYMIVDEIKKFLN